MPDEFDPPRKHYELKPREFESVNTEAKNVVPLRPAADPGIIAASTGRIDAQELVQIASKFAPRAKPKSLGTPRTDVHEMLELNYETERAAGAFQVEAGIDKKRRRRLRNYSIGMISTIVPLGIIAYLAGPDTPIPFVIAIGGIGMSTAVLTWQTFFLRTD